MAKFIAKNRQCVSVDGIVHTFEPDKDGVNTLEPTDKIVEKACRQLAEDESTTVQEIEPKPKKAKK